MKMATLAFSTPQLILQRFAILRRPTPPYFHAVLTPHAKQSCSRITASSFSISSAFSSCSLITSASPAKTLTNFALAENAQIETETESVTISSAAAEALKTSNVGAIQTPPPSLTVKEKKELASYAHSLGKKLKSQQIGKSGVTDTVVTALIETLEANELLKLKVHGTCPVELEDVVKQLEETTGSVVVGQIGRTVILYRPSQTKLKAEEKKKQAQRVYLKRQLTAKQSPQSKRPVSAEGQEPRQLGRGRRGRSRF